MFIPCGTDAPIYHRPWSTVGLVALNVIIFGIVASGSIEDETAGQYVLWYGDGLHPTQWITSNFMHSGLEHLAGNMIFLWVFGQIVEGKLGWKRFLPIYLGIGALQCAIEQAATLVISTQTEYSLGASAILFGLLAMAMVWAPQNDVHIFYWLGWRMGTFSLTIRALALIYLGLEVALALFASMVSEGAFTGPALHLMGAGIGFPLAVVLLKRGVVDCEGWDIFSLRGGKPKEIKLYRDGAAARAPGEPPPRETEESRRARIGEERSTALELMEGYLREGNPALAAAAYNDCVRANGPWPLEEAALRSLVKGYQDAGLLHEARPFIEEHIARFPERAHVMKLLLAKVLIEKEGRPISGLEVLESIPAAAPLTGAQRKVFEKLLAEANRLRDAGVLELD